MWVSAIDTELFIRRMAPVQGHLLDAGEEESVCIICLEKGPNDVRMWKDWCGSVEVLQ